MILGFEDERTAAFAAGEPVREFAGFDRQGWNRLEILEAALTLADLRALPNDCLDGLQGDRAGQFSIRIDAQWRTCFVWSAGDAGPSEVEIVDYR